MRGKGLGVFLGGTSIGFLGCALLVMALILTGNMALLGRFPRLGEVLQWLWENFRLSIVFFPLALKRLFLQSRAVKIGT